MQYLGIDLGIVSSYHTFDVYNIEVLCLCPPALFLTNFISIHSKSEN